MKGKSDSNGLAVFALLVTNTLWAMLYASDHFLVVPSSTVMSVSLHSSNSKAPTAEPPNVSNSTHRSVPTAEPSNLTESPDPFPRHTLIEDFPARSTMEATRRHDRVLIEGMAFIEGMSKKDIQRWNEEAAKYTPTTLSINIMTSNRQLRYIDALLMMLMRGQTPEKLFSYTRINLINIERRPEKIEYHHFRHTLSKFTFLNMYNLTDLHRLDPKASFMGLSLRLDTVDGLNICEESKLPYCLMLEDDTVPPVDFLDNLEKFVIGPMRLKTVKPASISLYSYHSHEFGGEEIRIDNPIYVKTKYDDEKSKTNAERLAEGMEPYTPDFQLVRMNVSWGAVANLYSLDMAVKLRDFVASFGNETIPPPVDHLMHRPFSKHVGRSRLQVEPSLMNHIGGYSERRNVVSFLDFDVRFQLDAGTTVIKE